MTYAIQQGLFKYDITDYHAILGVPLGASTEQVRQRYLAIAHRLHPDTCKAEGTQAKEQASQLLSKLVNPAYEKLGKNRSRTDYLLTLSQMGKTLAEEQGKLTLTNELAKQLERETENTDLTYRKLLQSLIKKQYEDLNIILEKIGQISELNLVYLKKMGGHELQQKKQIPFKANTTNSDNSEKFTPGKGNSEKATPGEEEISPMTRYIRRAREAIEQENWSKAILELRDALKITPNDSTCYSLLGLIYLKQNQLTMAKIHIDKAYQIDPKNPDTIQAKQALDLVMPELPPENRGGIWVKLFGGKKNK